MKTLYSILFLIVGFGFTSAQESQQLASSQPMPKSIKSEKTEANSKNQKLASDEPLFISSNKGTNETSQAKTETSMKLASESEIIPPKKEIK